MRVFPGGDFTIVIKQSSDNHDHRPSGLAKDDEKKKKKGRMNFRYKTLTQIHIKVNSREGTFQGTGHSTVD